MNFLCVAGISRAGFNDTTAGCADHPAAMGRERLAQCSGAEGGCVSVGQLIVLLICF